MTVNETERLHSMMSRRFEEFARERELEELERLRAQIAAGSRDERKMARALELVEKYFGIEEEV